jgi:hypothetical protein
MTELLNALAAGRRPRPRALVAPLVAVTLILLVTLSVRALARTEGRADGRSDARTITIVARDMSFYLPGESVKNPRLVAGRGELLRIVLKNDDPGMAHDLSFPSLGVASPMLRRSGTEAEVVLRAPQQPGRHEYLCSLHALLMRGELEVR